MDNGTFGHQFKKQERNYSRLKSNAEDLLLRLVEKGVVKVGSQEYNDRCAAIEYFDTMASRLNTRYNEND